MGIDYQLYNNGIAVGSPVAGTGSPIDFGPQPSSVAHIQLKECLVPVLYMLGSVSVSLFPPPTASAGSNTPVCEGDQLKSHSKRRNFYNWSGPNSFTNTGQNPAIAGVTTAATGTYTVNVIDANGCAATATTDVVITPANTISLSSAAGTDGQTNCINTPITDITYATTGATGSNIYWLTARCYRQLGFECSNDYRHTNHLPREVPLIIQLP